jgi:hypothetical protein
MKKGYNLPEEKFGNGKDNAVALAAIALEKRRKQQ